VLHQQKKRRICTPAMIFTGLLLAGSTCLIASWEVMAIDNTYVPVGVQLARLQPFANVSSVSSAETWPDTIKTQGNTTDSVAIDSSWWNTEMFHVEWVLIWALLSVAIFIALALASYEAYSRTITSMSAVETSKFNLWSRAIIAIHSTRSFMAPVLKPAKELMTEPSVKAKSRLLVVAITMIMILEQATGALLSSRLHSAVVNELAALSSKKDMSDVRKALLKRVLCIILLEIPLFQVVKPLAETCACIHYQTFLVERCSRPYLSGDGHAFYYIKVADTGHDVNSPEQRLTENLKTVSEMSLTLYQRFISWLVGPILWISVIYQMGGFWLLIPCLLSTMFETLVSFAGFGKSVMSANNVRQSTMADVRYALTNIRDSAEEIALCHGESRELHRVSRLYELNLRASWRAKLVELRKGVAVGLPSVFPAIIIWIILLPDMSKGSLQMGDASRVLEAYWHLKSIIAVFSDNFDLITELKVNADRLNNLFDVCTEANIQAARHKDENFRQDVTQAAVQACPLPQSDRACVSLEMAETDVALAFEAVSVKPPGRWQNKPVGGLSFTCPAGEAVLVMGPSGIGKTSLLRAVSGLWRSGYGRISLPTSAPSEGLYSLPSRCFLPAGTLEELILYPRDWPCRNELSSNRATSLTNSLHRAQLGHVIERWGLEDSRDWRALLSTGEQQRVSFARLFFALSECPANCALAVLDEATSALDIATERLVYKELRKELLPGGGLTGVLSVGHRPSLVQYHDSLVVIGEDEPGTQESPQSNHILGEGCWLAPSGEKLPWRHSKLIWSEASPLNSVRY